MKKEKVIDYWADFFANHPDPSEFLEFASQYPSLTKIFNFCSAPNILIEINKDPFVFPFEGKIEESKSINNCDEEELQKLRMTTDIHADYLDYLSNLHLALKSILYLYHSGGAGISGKHIYIKILQNQIHFFNAHETKWFIGRYMPFFTLEIHQKKEINRINVVATLHWFLKPQETFFCHLDWDKWIITMLQDYRHLRWVKKFGFDDNIINAEVRNLYKGVLVQFNDAKGRDTFVVQTSKRYRPLVDKAVRRIKKSRTATDIFVFKKPPESEMLSSIINEDRQVEAYAILWESILSYDPVKGNPGSLFEKTLTHITSKLDSTNKLTTEAGEIACDDFCQQTRVANGETSCPFKSKEGYCADKHRKKRYISDITSSPEELRRDEENEDSIESDFPEGIPSPITNESITPLESMLEQEELGLRGDIMAHAEEDKRLMRILDSTEALSDADRKYKERKINELKKLILR